MSLFRPLRSSFRNKQPQRLWIHLYETICHSRPSRALRSSFAATPFPLPKRRPCGYTERSPPEGSSRSPAGDRPYFNEYLVEWRTNAIRSGCDAFKRLLLGVNINPNQYPVISYVVWGFYWLVCVSQPTLPLCHDVRCIRCRKLERFAAGQVAVSYFFFINIVDGHCPVEVDQSCAGGPMFRKTQNNYKKTSTILSVMECSFDLISLLELVSSVEL